MTIISCQVLPSGRLLFFNINSLIFRGFPLVSFHLDQATLSAFSWLYTSCVQLSKNITKYILFIIIHIFTLGFTFTFCNPPVSFAQPEDASKLWNNKCTVHVNERNQSKKTSHVIFKLTTYSIVRFSPQIMQWYHYMEI